jgi:hypothetical protein
LSHHNRLLNSEQLAQFNRPWVRLAHFAFGRCQRWARSSRFASGRRTTLGSFQRFCVRRARSGSRHRPFLRPLAHHERRPVAPIYLIIETSEVTGPHRAPRFPEMRSDAGTTIDVDRHVAAPLGNGFTSASPVDTPCQRPDGDIQERPGFSFGYPATLSEPISWNRRQRPPSERVPLDRASRGDRRAQV